MAKLVYSMVTSLDGYAEAAEGDLGTGADDPEVHTFINDLFRPVGTYLYGRRMYETMVYWETAHREPDQPPHILQYARDWQAAEKVVYSTTLESVSSERTRIERSFDPDAVRRLKSEADRDLTVIGDDGSGTYRFPFRVPLTAMDDLGGRLHQLLNRPGAGPC